MPITHAEQEALVTRPVNLGVDAELVLSATSQPLGAVPSSGITRELSEMTASWNRGGPVVDPTMTEAEAQKWLARTSAEHAFISSITNDDEPKERRHAGDELEGKFMGLVGMTPT